MLRKWIASSWVVAFALVVGSVVQADAQEEKKQHLPDGWHTDFTEAKEAAGKSNRGMAPKGVLAVFSASWCGPCQALVQNVYPDDKVKAALQKDWEPVYIDVDLEGNQELAAEFEIKALPTLVFLNSEGKEEGRSVGAPAQVDPFLALLKNKGAPDADTEEAMEEDGSQEQSGGFKEADADKNDKVSAKELENYVSGKLPDFDQFEELFKALDGDKNGSLSSKEFEKRFEAIQEIMQGG